MKPVEPTDTGRHGMFRSRLDQIINMGHEKVVLANRIARQLLSDKCSENYTDKLDHPALPTRLMAGLQFSSMPTICLVKSFARWVENPYYQYFCGEEIFRHDLPLSALL